MKTQTRLDSSRASYESPMMRVMEMRVHGMLCTSPKEETETTPEEDVF